MVTLVTMAAEIFRGKSGKDLHEGGADVKIRGEGGSEDGPGGGQGEGGRARGVWRTREMRSSVKEKILTTLPSRSVTTPAPSIVPMTLSSLTRQPFHKLSSTTILVPQVSTKLSV